MNVEEYLRQHQQIQPIEPTPQQAQQHSFSNSGQSSPTSVTTLVLTSLLLVIVAGGGTLGFIEWNDGKKDLDLKLSGVKNVLEKNTDAVEQDISQIVAEKDQQIAGKDQKIIELTKENERITSDFFNSETKNRELKGMFDAYESKIDEMNTRVDIVRRALINNPSLYYNGTR